MMNSLQAYKGGVREVDSYKCFDPVEGGFGPQPRAT